MNSKPEYHSFRRCWVTAEPRIRRRTWRWDAGGEGVDGRGKEAHENEFGRFRTRRLVEGKGSRADLRASGGKVGWKRMEVAVTHCNK